MNKSTKRNIYIQNDVFCFFFNPFEFRKELTDN